MYIMSVIIYLILQITTLTNSDSKININVVQHNILVTLNNMVKNILYKSKAHYII